MKRFLSILFVVLLGVLPAQVKFYVSAPAKAYTEEAYKVTFVVENAGVKQFKAPSFKGFKILSGPNQGSNYSWVNGKSTQSISYTYYLQALSTGTLTIDAAEAQINGKQMRTEAFTVEVVEGQSAARQQQNNAYQQMQQMQQQWQQQMQQQMQNQVQEEAIDANGNWKEQVADNLFVRLYADNSQPYVGEQIFVYAKLYQRVQTGGSQITDMPEFTGFWKQELDVNTQDWKVEEFEGKKFNTLVFAKFALFPLKEGTYKLDPIKMNSIVVIPKQVIENFFGMRVQSYTYEQAEYNFASNALTISAKALPTNGKPANFTGAVGQYSFDVSIDSTELNVGNPITLLAKVKGTGNLMAIDEPIFNVPRYFDKYDPEVKENISEKSEYVNGNITYKYILVPQMPGDYTLDSLSFSYFDPKQKVYKTIESEKYNIHVKGEIPKEIVATDSSENILESTQPFGIKTKADFDSVNMKNDIGGGYMVAMASPPLLYAFVLLFMGWRKKQEDNHVLLKHKYAQKVAQKRLKKAKTHLDNEDKQAFYGEIYDALNTYVQDKFSISQADLNKDLMVEKFTEKMVSPHLVDELVSLLTNAEMALYSPASLSKLSDDYQLALKWIMAIENELA